LFLYKKGEKYEKTIYFCSHLLVTALSFSVMAFRDDEPKKAKDRSTSDASVKRSKAAWPPK